MQKNFSPSSGAFAPLAEEEEENCARLGQYAASSGDLLPTFRNNLSVQSLGVKNLGWFTPWRLDRYVVPKRRQDITARCV